MKIPFFGEEQRNFPCGEGELFLSTNTSVQNLYAHANRCSLALFRMIYDVIGLVLY